MKKKEILQNALILPLVFGIVVAIIFCIFMNFRIDRLLPVPNDTVFAYHDSVEENAEKPNIDALTVNDNIGSITFGKTSLAIRYQADYSNLVGSISMLENSKALNETGFAYFKATSSNAREIKKAEAININSIYGEFNYSLVDEKSFDNEYQATIYAPKMKKGLVIIYQASDGYGLTSKYNALIFEEVSYGA